ncbi:hypothetical protein VHEMI10690 [[Torrubiella] hemipterigena]|uniref:Transcription factor domain-containing protein n=1 Tax=[Torrubiella] hemipterigena TaxID=1531966 RepID=A0A0A1TSP0_9HYPO|nr:hypothetical protein VHEMI10690 [[Torrubiella] hemipterigena]
MLSRFGADDVLDRSANAFLEGLMSIWAPSPEQTVKAIMQHGRALRCLREALYDPIRAKSPYTLYATILFMISRNWFSKGRTAQVSHMEGIVYLLNASARNGWACRDDNLRVSMLFPAAMEAIINRKITVDQWYTLRHAPSFGPHQPLHEDHNLPIGSLSLATILNIPNLLDEPQCHRAQIQTEYALLQHEYPIILKRLKALTDFPDRAESQQSLLVVQIQLETAGIYMLSYSLILNAFLATLDPLDNRLHWESIELAREAIRLSRECASHLPVGMGFVPWALLAAWAATSDYSITREIMVTMRQSDVYYADLEYVRMFRALKRRIAKLKGAACESCQCVGESHITCNDTLSFDWGMGLL